MVDLYKVMIGNGGDDSLACEVIAVSDDDFKEVTREIVEDYQLVNLDKEYGEYVGYVQKLKITNIGMTIDSFNEIDEFLRIIKH